MPKQPSITLFKNSTADRVLKATDRVLGPSSNDPGNGKIYPSLETYIVEITVDVSGGVKLEGKAVYLDENGAAQDWPAPYNKTFTVANGEPIFSLSPISVGDVVEIKESVRPDMTPYWLVSAAGGEGGATVVTRKLVQNKTQVLANSTGTWEIVGATDRGTHADEAALNTAYPSPLSGEYAYVTATSTYWTVSSGSWVNSGGATKVAAGIEGTWTAKHSSTISYEVDCAAGAYMWVEWVDALSLWLANENFAAYRGPLTP